MTYRVTVTLDRADRSDLMEAQAVINETIAYLKAMPGRRSVKHAKTNEGAV